MCIGERPPTQSQRDDYSFARARSRDADEHAARLSGWDQTYEQLTPGPFEGFLCEALFAGIQLFRETTNQSVHELGAGRAGTYMFGVPIALQGEGCFDGRPIGLDSILVLRDRGPLDFRAPAPLDLVGVSMPIDALRRYALEIDERDVDDELRDVAVASPAPERVRRLRAFLLLALESICGHPQKLQHPVTRRALEHAVYRSVVDTFVTAGEEAVAAPGPTRSHALVSRAQEYMREHLDEPLTVEDLCRHLQVSRRTLQYGFSEVLRLNPVAYLRALRLNGVRRALRNAAQGTTVQDVAARWGFWHLSHFACDYRRMFGELPSETLHGTACV
ncbi:MAG TPA: helix-turn-helix domain-containing protein [Zeimonas sp.]